MATLEDQRVSDEQLRDITGVSAAEEAGMDASAQSDSAAEAEQDQLGNGYQPNGKKKITANRRWWTKKRAGIAGTIAGFLGFGGILGGGLLTGPLEILHFSNILHITNHVQMEDDSSSRITKLWRLYRTNDVSRTRLGYFANKMVPKIDASMKDSGFTVNRKLGNMTSITIDLAKAEGTGQFDDLKQQTINKYGSEGLSFSKYDGTATLSVDNTTLKGNFKALGEIWDISKASSSGKIAAFIKFRTITQRYNISLHPMKIADNKIQGRFSAWLEARNSKLKPTGKWAEKVNDLKSTVGGKTAVGLLSGTAVICAAHAVYDGIGDARYAGAVIPAMQLAGSTLAAGYQIEAGEDVSIQQMGYIAKQYETVDSKTNKVTDTANDSAAYRAATGQTGGTPMSTDTSTAFSTDTSAWSYLDATPIKTACSTVGSVVLGGLGLGLSIVSDGAVSAIADAAGSTLLGGAAMLALTHLANNMFAGQTIVGDTGAALMNDTMYGDRALANEDAIAAGGTALSSSQEAQQLADAQTQQKNTFDQQNFLARIFNPYVENSLTQHLALDLSPSFSSNLYTLASAVTNVGGALSSLGSLLPSAHADDVTTFDYGFPKYGFSDADLNNSAVADPYANADAVADLFDAGQYIDKAQNCFGVSVSKDATGAWGVAWNNSDVNPFATNYTDNGCADSSDPNWLKVRMFILDSQTMDGYACYNEDAEACSDLGISPSTDSTNGTTLVFGDSYTASCLPTAASPYGKCWQEDMASKSSFKYAAGSGRGYVADDCGAACGVTNTSYAYKIGANYGDTLGAIDKYKPTTIIVQGGLNDGGAIKSGTASLSKVTSVIDTFYTKLAQELQTNNISPSSVYAVAAWPSSAACYATDQAQIVAEIQKDVTAMGGHFVTTSTITQLSGSSADCVTHIHPNSGGFSKLAGEIHAATGL